jgi:hypothetical protein
MWLTGTGTRPPRRSSRTVFGEGAADAAVVLVGEQPGDMEDRQGTDGRDVAEEPALAPGCAESIIGVPDSAIFGFTETGKPVRSPAAETLPSRASVGCWDRRRLVRFGLIGLDQPSEPLPIRLCSAIQAGSLATWRVPELRVWPPVFWLSR